MFPEGEWSGDAKRDQSAAAYLAAREWVKRGGKRDEAYGFMILVCKEFGLAEERMKR